jgi:hypothetical protein
VPSLVTHISQANHNEDCANLLLSTAPRYRDWAITAAFYAAVHLAEAAFSTRRDVGHTETALDRKDREKHQYRQDKIRELARPAYASYRKLYNASSVVRYLVVGDDKLARDYYSSEDARRLVTVHLPTVRQELENAFGIRLS